MRPMPREIGADACVALPPGARFRVRVSGTSMIPVLLDGDEVEAVRVPASEAALGDLVVLDQPGVGLVVHRLLWRTGTVVRTWGDGSRRMDAPAPPERLLGRVVSASRAGRDVMPSPGTLRLQWGRQFLAAVLHRLRRRLSTGPGSALPSTSR